MGRYTFRLPDIGEGIAEAEIIVWHVKVGDRVEVDGRLADVMTDKATVEMESPVSGTVIEVAGDAGEIIAIGSPLVVIETESRDEADCSPPAGDAAEPAAAPPNVADEPVAAASSPAERDQDRGVPLSCATSAMAEPALAAAASPDRRVLAAPAVRARAADLGIDLAQLQTGVEGRVRHSDLDAFVAYNGSGGYQAAGKRRADEVVKVIGLRRRIAENMAASKRHIPHFSYVERYDVTALEGIRAELNAARGDRPRLTMLPFLIAAICRLIPRYPMLNAHFDDERGEVTRFGAVHLGMAAQTPAGLTVPVIRDAQNRNLWQLAGEIARLAQAVRDGTAKSAELSGSTITLTSLGPMGGVATTPVINRPEVAIVGPNRIEEMPMFVRDATGTDRLEKRKLMNISMSCDHRVVDGWDAASFAQDLKKLIESPALILTEGLG